MWDSPMHLLIIAIVILVLFGGRKIPEVMKGLGQGVREVAVARLAGEVGMRQARVVDLR